MSKKTRIKRFFAGLGILMLVLILGYLVIRPWHLHWGSQMNHTAEHIERLLLKEIADVCPELSASELRVDASLTADLGLDSLCLTSLFSMIKREIGAIELSSWFIRASNSGIDTIASLAEHLACAAQRRAA